MLLLVHAPQPRAVAILRDAAIPGRVGPTSATGWTAAWLESTDALPVRPAESHVVLAEGGDDGSFVDQAGTGFGDWAFAGLALVATCVLAPTSVYRFRRLRGRSSR